MVNLNVNSTVNKDALSTNLTRGSQEVKDERLKNAKNMVAKLNEQEEARALFKFSFGCMLTLILFVVSYFIVSLFLFKGNEFILQIFYAGLLSGFLGYIITVLIIVTGTFFDSRDYSLLSLLLPVIIPLGVFSKKIRKIVGISIIFHILFILLIMLSVFLICVFQEITLSQLPIILKSNLVASGFSADNIINAFKNFISYFFGLDDRKYDS